MSKPNCLKKFEHLRGENRPKDWPLVCADLSLLKKAIWQKGVKLKRQLYRPRNGPGPEIIPNWIQNDREVNLGMVWRPSARGRIHSETILFYDEQLKGFPNA